MRLKDVRLVLAVMAVALGQIAVASRAEAAYASAIVVESIDNSNNTLTFNGSPFTGLIRNITPGQSNPPAEDRAIVVFDLRSFIGASGATLAFTITGNNYGGDSIRTFTESLFASTGVGLLTDFNAPATSQVGTQTFDIFTSPRSFSIDLTAAQIAATGPFLGVRFAATDPNSFPSIVQSVTLDVAAASVPEPASVMLLGVGLTGAGVAARGRRRAR